MGGSSKRVTVGYKYYVGMHLILCHGMIDKIFRIRVDGRDAWLGSRRNGRININKPSLFGGESREGGIVGAIDFENGNSSQTKNDYLVSKLGSLVPAFRGVAGVVLRQVYLGMNPYLKNWDFRIQRIHFRQNGDVQWYDEKAEILVPGKFKQPQAFYFALDISGSMSKITSNGQTRLFNAVQAVKQTLDVIDTLRIDSNVRVDIRITAWSVAGTSPSITQYNVSTSAINSLKTWLDSLTPGGGTDFREGVVNVAGFYGAVPQDANRVVIFATDGVPSITGDPGEAEIITAEAAATLFATPDIQSFAFNIDLEDTTYTAQMDNTLGGVPVLDGSDSEAMADAIFFAIMGDSSAMNPAHIIRECLTDQDWGMGYAESDIDDISFSLAADALYSENMGISLLWDTQTSIEEFVKEIVRHIDAALFVDRATGKFVLKLIRDDFNEDDLITLDESNIDKITDFKRPAFGELINAVTVTYWDVNSGEDATLTISDIALAQQQGNTNLSSIKYPGFVTSNIASRVAQRDLKQLSTPLASCTIYANTDAENFNIGSVFKLDWPDYDVSGLIMRVTGIAYGDGRTNRIRIQCAQDVFSLPENAFIPETPPVWEDPSVAPMPVSTQLAFEVPYLELVQVQGQSAVDNLLTSNPDAGYVAAAAVRPQSAALSCRLYTNNGSGYQDLASVDFCPGAKLAENINQTATAFSISDLQEAEIITLGTWFQIGEELMSVEAISASSITVKRGVLDTVPVAHTSGAALIFWDAYADNDPTEYVASDIVTAKLLTITGSGQLPLSSALEDTVTLASRAIRPYPPGNVKINGSYFPAVVTGDLVLTWASRNRVQQTGGTLVEFTASDITPETGTTYEIDLVDTNLGTIVQSVTGITDKTYTFTAAQLHPYASQLTLKLYSKRDGYRSFKGQICAFLNDNGILIVATNFSSETVGNAPANWSYPWNSPATKIIETRAASIGGKAFKLANTANQRTAAVWDGANWTSNDMEITAVVELVGSTTTVNVITGIGGRIAGAAATENCCALWIQYQDAQGLVLQAGYYSNGTTYFISQRFSQLEGAPAGFYALKIRIKGSSFHVKAWRLSAYNSNLDTTEPAFWMLGHTTTIATGTKAGHIIRNINMTNYLNKFQVKEVADLKPIEVSAYFQSGFVNTTSVAFQIPIVAKVGDMLVLSLMRREAVSSGLTGWTLVQTQTINTDAITQYLDLYVKTATFSDIGTPGTPVSVTVTCAASSRLAANLVVLTSGTNQTISVENSTSSSNISKSNGSELALPSLAAASNNSVALVACSTGFATTTLPAYFGIKSTAAFQQFGQRQSTDAANQTRMVVGLKRMTNGENINEAGLIYETSIDGTANYQFIQTAAIFKVT